MMSIEKKDRQTDRQKKNQTDRQTEKKPDWQTEKNHPDLGTFVKIEIESYTIWDTVKGGQDEEYGD